MTIDRKLLPIFCLLLFVAKGCLLRQSTHPIPVTIATFAGLNGEFGEPFGIAERNGAVFVSDGEKGVIWRISNGNKIEQFVAGLETPSGIAFDRNGDLIVADSGTNAVLSIDPNGKITQIAGITVHTATKTEMADSTTQPSVVENSYPRLHGPIGISIAKSGLIFVSDTYNDRICVIENGNFRVLAGGEKGFADGSTPKFDTPTGIAIWRDKLIVADTGNNRVRVVEEDGSSWTLAGNGESDLNNGTLLSASFVQPIALGVKDDVIFIADRNSIRVIGGGVIPSVRTLNDGELGFVDGPLRNAKLNRPSGLAFDSDGNLLIADSDNRVIRIAGDKPTATAVTHEDVVAMRVNPNNFRNAAPARWPFDPGNAKRDIAGTFGELRGDVKPGNAEIHFHNGLDVVGAYGEMARFVRAEKVLLPEAVQNFSTLRELIRLPTLGYIHVRIGRLANGTTFDDERFQFIKDGYGRLAGVRVPRGTKFNAGEPIGTLNAMNHVHLIAGRSGDEMNAIDALQLPGISDTRSPVIEKIGLFEQNWHPIETVPVGGRIIIDDRIRITVRAFDQIDGNSERRRLGIFKAGYQVLKPDMTPADDTHWSITFDRLPPADSVAMVYANGSHSGATGVTIFDYIVTNTVSSERAVDSYFDPNLFEPGNYILRCSVSDYFGNTTYKDVKIEVKR